MRNFILICLAVLISQTSFAQESVEEVQIEIEAQEEAPKIEVKEYLNLSYGPHARHALDVYVPENAKNAPILFMVHGGAWRIGDKASKGFVEKKLGKWAQEGFIVVSTNYRFLPTLPYNQAQDVRNALHYVQENAHKWNANPNKVILLGHSAGAHLVGLVNTNPKLSYRLGVKPWLGAVLLDSAALDVVKLMKEPHARLYDKAFGSKLYVWRKSSPYHQLTSEAKPMALVCSEKREESCAQTLAFARQADTFGVETRIIERMLSHSQINTRLGDEGEYTDLVDDFIQSLLKR
ncbi:MAG: carboxylesterase family protein [Bdellovibrionales bacterium]